MNCYRISYHPHHNSYTIYPRHLSVYHSNNSYLQVDLLLDSEVIRPDTYTTATYDHVLLILNLPRLVSSLSTLHKKNNLVSAHICRQCLSLFNDVNSFHIHHRVCGAFGPGNLKRRISHNRFIHKSTIYSKRLKRHLDHTLHFATKHLYTLRRPISFMSMDFEASNVKPDHTIPCPYSKVPNNAVYEQTILAGSYCIKNVFPNFPLPLVLQQPRCLVREQQSIQQFYLDFFKMIRSDVQLVH